MRLQDVSACPLDTILHPTDFEFLEPVTVSIREEDGREHPERFGIGERVTIMSPAVNFLIAITEIKTQIPLADGRVITEFPRNMRTRMVQRIDN